MTASAGRRWAARAIAGAVFFAIGSTITCVSGKAAACASTWPRWPTPVTTIGGANLPASSQRRNVLSNRVLSSTNGRNGFGLLALLRGHNRVPLPPQRTTGYIFVMLADYLWKNTCQR